MWERKFQRKVAQAFSEKQTAVIDNIQQIADAVQKGL